MLALLRSLDSKIAILDKAIKFVNTAELRVELAELKTAHAALINENRELKAEIEELEKNPLRYDGFVYRDNDKHPFCPACYDDKKKRIHLKPSPTWNKICPICDKEFTTMAKRPSR